jgi:hypothetical protein
MFQYFIHFTTPQSTFDMKRSPSNFISLGTELQEDRVIEFSKFSF